MSIQSNNIIAHQLDENYTSVRHQSRNHDGEIIIIHIHKIIDAWIKWFWTCPLQHELGTDGQIKLRRKKKPKQNSMQ